MYQYKCNLYLLSCLFILILIPLIPFCHTVPFAVDRAAGRCMVCTPDSPDAKKPPRKGGFCGVGLRLNFGRSFQSPYALNRAAGTKFCFHHNLNGGLLVLGGGVNRDLGCPDFIVIKHIICPPLSGHCSSPFLRPWENA